MSISRFRRSFAAILAGTMVCSNLQYPGLMISYATVVSEKGTKTASFWLDHPRC